MTASTPAPAGATPSPAKKSHAAAGDIQKGLLDNIQATRDVLTAAANPAFAKIFDKEVKQSAVDAMATQVELIDDPLMPAVINTKKAVLAATQAEQALGDNLVAKLRWLQGQATRTFGSDKAKRAAYLIGKPNFGRNRETLDADARAILALAKADTLENVDPVADLPPIQQLLDKWVAADAEQKNRQAAAGAAVQALEGAVATLNAGRRDIQKGADNTFSYTVAANAPARRAFQLPANQPYNLHGGPV